MITSIIKALFINFQPNMSKKRNDKESVICFTPKPSKKKKKKTRNN